MKLCHISDFHFSSNYLVKYGEKVLYYLDKIRPDFVVITGDLTDNGYYEEFLDAKKYIDKISCENVLTVMGNHDARNGGYEIFEEIFKTRYPVVESRNLIILGIDSSEPDIDEGHIGRANYSYIEEKLKKEKNCKIIALHHHLIPIPKTGRERHIPVDSGDFLKLIDDLQVDIVLSGHKHNQWIWRLNNTIFVTCGTSTSKKLKGKGYQSFNLIEVEKEFISIDEINLTNDEKRSISYNRKNKVDYLYIKYKVF
ncbi:MAG: metallophosphoesterase [candidate division WOR-3 bacterium]